MEYAENVEELDGADYFEQIEYLDENIEEGIALFGLENELHIINQLNDLVEV